MFAIGLNCICCPSSVAEKERNLKIGLALDLLAGIGLILAAVYSSSPFPRTYTAIALCGAEISAGVFFVLHRFIDKMREDVANEKKQLQDHIEIMQSLKNFFIDAFHLNGDLQRANG